ncbi:MAG TPA: thioredoxin family protein, partial [Flavobacterium sp.]|nr:thioredoxin family protein [Flavobacterium sp.]
MKTIFQEAYKKSMSYTEYLNLIDEKIAQQASTGNEQSELLTDFTKLNRARMKRLDKTQELLPEIVEAVKNIQTQQIWLVLTESWCGDAAQHLPVFHKMANLQEKIDLRLVLRDDND